MHRLLRSLSATGPQRVWPLRTRSDWLQISGWLVASIALGLVGYLLFVLP
jgi:hypothetical protein